MNVMCSFTKGRYKQGSILRGNCFDFGPQSAGLI